MSSYSPWGAIQDSTQICAGVRWVSTASHGGLMVTKQAAAKYLSEQAIKAIHCTPSADYACFEEDCEYAIAFFERPEWKRFLDQDALNEYSALCAQPSDALLRFEVARRDYALKAIPKLLEAVSRTDDQIREEMRAIVERWNPEYFGLPNRCGGCDAELPASKGYGFILCDECNRKRGLPTDEEVAYTYGVRREVEPSAILPGFAKAVEKEKESAAIVKAEALAREANTPKNIDAAAGVMETLSPLFRGTDASPQAELFKEVRP